MRRILSAHRNGCDVRGRVDAQGEEPPSRRLETERGPFESADEAEERWGPERLSDTLRNSSLTGAPARAAAALPGDVSLSGRTREA